MGKRGFTLGELIMVFVIIGIIATVGVTTLKPWERAYKHAYTRIYNGLATAIYNYIVTTPNNSGFPSTPSGFCNALLVYLNTADDAANNPTTNPCNLSGDKNDFLGNTPTAADFLKDGKNPKIKLSNGAYLWIGADFSENEDGAPFSYTQTIDSTTDVIKYYLVYADLNGDMGPNTPQFKTVSSKVRLPDIVAFAVTDKFSVIPLGYPKVDQRYLSAHIMYPLNEEDDLTDAGDKPSDSMTYYEAIVGAYGKSPNKIITMGLPQTYDLEESLPNDNIFKLVGSDLDNRYADAPTFDQELCGDGSTAAQIISAGDDSHCTVRVFDYN